MGWTFAYRGLMGAFLLTAALNLVHARAGFLTNYLADITVPALLYVLARNLVPGKQIYPRRLTQTLGRTPETAGPRPVPGERRNRGQSSLLARRILRRAL